MCRNPGLTNTLISIASKVMTAFSHKLARLFLSLTTLLAVHSANADYSTSQIESDLAQNPAFEQINSDDYLYTKSQYVDDLRSNSIVSLSNFHGWLKSLDVKLLPKPSLVPVGVDGLPIFIPTYPVPKRVGDKFVQRVVVLEQLRYWLGSTVKWTGSSTLTEELLIDNLYSSGKEYARLNGLVLGSPLPQDQWQASGHGDIIWPEFRTIYGQQVLVPIVYLTANTINNYAVNDHITSPSNSTAVLNSLTIGASASMHIRNQVLQLMEGFYADGNVSVDKANERIVVGGTLDVHGGSITAEENLNIVAHAIALRPTVVLSDDRFGQSQVIGSLASVNAPNGSIKLSSYRLLGEDGSRTGNIYVEGAQVSGQSVELYAPSGNIDILATQLRSTADQVIPGGHYSRSEIDYVSSVISGEEAVSLIAGGEINVKASDLISDKGVVEILAGTGIYIENEFGMVQQQMHQKIGKTTTDMSQLQTIAIQANLKAGKGIRLNSDAGPIRLKAVDIESQEGTQIHALDGQVQLLMAKEQDKYQYSRIKKSLLTIKTTTESWDKDTPVYNTIVGGLEVNATRGVVVEYGGKEGESSAAQIEALAKLPGLSWMGDLHENDARNCSNIHGGGWDDLSLEERQALVAERACIDFGFLELMDKYDYESTTNLSPAAMAVISIAAAMATGGTSLAVTAPASAGPAMVASISAINAGISTLVTQATIGIANGAVNGDSPYEVWKDLGSKENLRQLASSMVTAGALSYANDLMQLEGISAFTAGSEDGSLNLLGQSAQVVTRTTVSSAIDVLAQGNSLSDFGSDFEDQFRVSIVNNVTSAIGQHAASKIGAAFDGPNADGLDTALKYISHAAVGCIIGAANASVSSGVDAEENCYAQGGGAVVGELVGSYLRDSEQQQAAQQEVENYLDNQLQRALELSGLPPAERNAIMRSELAGLVDEARMLALRGVDIAKLTAGVTALLAGADAAAVNAAAAGAGNAAMYNAYTFQLSMLADALSELEEFLKRPNGPLELITMVLADKALELGVQLAENPQALDSLLGYVGLTSADLLSQNIDLNNPAIAGGVAAGIIDILGGGAVFADVGLRGLFVPLLGADVHEGTILRAEQAGADFVSAIENLDQVLPTMSVLLEAAVVNQDPSAQAQVARLATSLAIGVKVGVVTGGAGMAAVSSSILRTLDRLHDLASIDLENLLGRLPFNISIRRHDDGRETVDLLPKQESQPLSSQLQQSELEARDRAFDLESQSDRLHSIDRHGPELTDEQLIRRLQTGVAPDERIAWTNASTRFKSYQEWEATRQAAIEQAKADGLDLSKPPVPGSKAATEGYPIEIVHDRPIGDGFVADTSDPTSVHTHRYATGKGKYKTFDNYNSVSGLTKTVTRIKWDDSTNNWHVVQHYPDGTDWNEALQRYE